MLFVLLEHYLWYLDLLLISFLFQTVIIVRAIFEIHLTCVVVFCEVDLGPSEHASIARLVVLLVVVSTVGRDMLLRFISLGD